MVIQQICHDAHNLNVKRKQFIRVKCTHPMLSLQFDQVLEDPRDYL